MRIATWNINSVRLRINQALRFIKEQNIDILCLQETKTENKHFPISEFIDAGMKHYNFRGEKSYNGVAILSKIKIKNKRRNGLVQVDLFFYLRLLIFFCRLLVCTNHRD